MFIDIKLDKIIFHCSFKSMTFKLFSKYGIGKQKAKKLVCDKITVWNTFVKITEESSRLIHNL